MNNDGWQTAGTGQSDMRIAGKDRQHSRQPRTASEYHEPIRRVTRLYEGGGPMKEHMEHEEHENKHKPNHLSELLEEEKEQHHKAKEHAHHHLERHHKRHYDSQHGHDHHKHTY